MQTIKRILLVEDDEDDQYLFCEALGRIHPTIFFEIARDGSEAIQRVEKAPAFDFIFMDLNMPKMNGIECLKRLKGNGIHQNVPVIMISTSTQQKDIDQCMDLGAAYYFTKPVNFEGLFRKVDDIIAGRILLQSDFEFDDAR